MKHLAPLYLVGLVSLAGLVSLPAGAKPASFKGTWQAPFGSLRFKQQGAEVTASVTRTAKGCSLKPKQQVLSGILLEDNLTGEISVCQVGEGCAPTAKAFVIMLVSKNGKLLTGALHLPKPGCKVPGMGAKRGLRIYKRGNKPKPRIRKPHRDPKPHKSGDPLPSDAELELAGKNAQVLLEEGFGLLTRGQVEDARARFVKASEVDPSRAEAFNGVGVTFYARQKYTEALGWYKKALEANPDFGDSFYNMACIYAIERKKELALRYLKIALLNRYVGADDISHITEDPDFSNLKEDPDFKALLSEVHGTP